VQQQRRVRVRVALRQARRRGARYRSRSTARSPQRTRGVQQCALARSCLIRQRALLLLPRWQRSGVSDGGRNC